jgi:hypothetical protein
MESNITCKRNVKKHKSNNTSDKIDFKIESSKSTKNKIDHCIMIKESIQEEKMTKYLHPNTRACKYIKQISKGTNSKAIL